MQGFTASYAEYVCAWLLLQFVFAHITGTTICSISTQTVHSMDVQYIPPSSSTDASSFYPFVSAVLFILRLHDIKVRTVQEEECAFCFLLHDTYLPAHRHSWVCIFLSCRCVHLLTRPAFQLVLPSSSPSPLFDLLIWPGLSAHCEWDMVRAAPGHCEAKGADRIGNMTGKAGRGSQGRGEANYLGLSYGNGSM